MAKVDTAALAMDAGKWRVLETLLAERGWRREDVTPEAVAEAAAIIERPRTSRYDVPLPLDDTEADDAA